MDKDNNFSVSGLPSNEPFEVEVPDDTKRAINRAGNSKNDIISMLKKEIGALSPEDFKKMIPPEQLKAFEDEAANLGEDLDEVINRSLGVMKNAMENIQPNTGVDGLIENINQTLDQLYNLGLNPNEGEEQEEEEMSATSKYNLGLADYLHPEDFGSIKCITDPNLYQNFIEKFGTDSTKYLDDATGITSFIYSDNTVKLTSFPLKGFKYITSTDNYILFYAEPADETKYGYFMAVVKSAEDEYTAFIPEFGNTFKIDDNDENVDLYGPSTDPEFFEPDQNGNATFLMLNMSTLMFSVQFHLAPYKNVILSPKKFGTIKNVIAPITKPSSMLKIGNIVSNESPEAILLKKDADLPLNDIIFPLYIHFGNVISEDSLKIIQQILFKVDFNKLTIFDYCELKWTSDHKLYVDIDLGEF